MKKFILPLKDVNNAESEEGFVGVNLFQVTRCDPINNGKNSKLTMKAGPQVVVYESPAEILNIYLDWTSRLTRRQINVSEDK